MAERLNTHPIRQVSSSIDRGKRSSEDTPSASLRKVTLKQRALIKYTRLDTYPSRKFAFWCVDCSKALWYTYSRGASHHANARETATNVKPLLK
jgi:hypothetical protein